MWKLFRWHDPPRHECQSYSTAPGEPGFSPVNRALFHSPAMKSPEKC
ncbi:MAG: hypothetical protein L6R45_21810 [Anaerolineae bacterium]|nr:hypothetical protein [Anaerolineae bacterium]